METKYEVILDSATADGCFSIKKQEYIEFNGNHIDTKSPERCTFSPGQFAELKEYAPEFEAMAKAIWTTAVIEAWQSKQDAMEIGV